MPKWGREKLDSRRFSLADAREQAARRLAERAARSGIAIDKIETVYEEEFNLIRGFSTIGKILTCRLQIKPGVLQHIAGKEGVL